MKLLVDEKMVWMHLICFTMLNISMAAFIITFKLNKDHPTPLREGFQTWTHLADAIFASIFQMFVAYILIKAVTPIK